MIFNINSTRGHTGSLLVYYNAEPIFNYNAEAITTMLRQ